jgi:hypothetical protein
VSGARAAKPSALTTTVCACARRLPLCYHHFKPTRRYCAGATPPPHPTTNPNAPATLTPASHAARPNLGAALYSHMHMLNVKLTTAHHSTPSHAALAGAIVLARRGRPLLARPCHCHPSPWPAPLARTSDLPPANLWRATQTATQPRPRGAPTLASPTCLLAHRYFLCRPHMDSNKAPAWTPPYRCDSAATPLLPYCCAALAAPTLTNHGGEGGVRAGGQRTVPRRQPRTGGGGQKRLTDAARRVGPAVTRPEAGVRGTGDGLRRAADWRGGVVGTRGQCRASGLR